MHSGRLALACLLVLVACDHRPEDFAKARDQTAEFQTTWGQRLDGLGTLHGQLLRRAQSIPDGTPGLSEVNSRLAAVKTQLDALGPTLTGATDNANAQLAAHHRKLAGETLGRAGAELRTGVDAVAAQLNDIGPLLDAVAAAGAAPPPAPSAFDIKDPAFPKTGKAAEVAGIAFKPATADLDLENPTTKPALDTIVAFASSCDNLRFAVVAHTAKDGDAAVNQNLSDAQAQTVVAYLAAAGVDTAKIVQVQGVGGKQPLVAEPDPGTPEEAAMATAELAEIRAKNRRITVLVISPCP
jgi:outer membrane protein OmpA-like peptidoglycan-associated protein